MGAFDPERCLSDAVPQPPGLPCIGFRTGGLGRRATLLGTRLDVWQVLETVRNHGNSAEQAADYLNLPAGLICAAISYAVSHSGEIEQIAACEIAAAARAEKLWRAEQGLPAL